MQRLMRTIPDVRLGRYRDACQGRSEHPIRLYLWAHGVALAVFSDIAHVEVALRSAMAESLCREYGFRWFERRDLLDHPTLKAIAEASKVARLDDLQASDEVIHGKLVSTLTFGFWTRLLGKGTNLDGARRVYDTVIWKRAVRSSFPNVGDLERSRVQQSARVVQALRNRIAHHEHIVWGVPLPGQQRRLTLAEAWQSLGELAGFLDSDLSAWLRESSEVPVRIDECPVGATHGLGVWS